MPPGYTHETILVAAHGVTGTIDRYGTVLRRRFNTTRAPDIATSHIGYWTDNVSHACSLYFVLDVCAGDSTSSLQRQQLPDIPLFLCLL